MTTTTHSHKLYLQNYAVNKANEFNKVISSIHKVVGFQLSNTQLEQLSGLFSMLEIKSEQADRSWERYSDYCEQHGYKTREIVYLSDLQFHTTN